MVESQLIPVIKINLDLHLISTDLLKGDQWWVDRSGGLHEHPALHFRWQQPLEALELTHCNLIQITGLNGSEARCQAVAW